MSEREIVMQDFLLLLKMQIHGRMKKGDNSVLRLRKHGESTAAICTVFILVTYFVSMTHNLL